VTELNVAVVNPKSVALVPLDVYVELDVRAPDIVNVPDPLATMGKLSVTPLVVVVCVPEAAAKVTVPVYVADTPVLAPVPLKVMLPYTLMAVVPAHVT
jgi:hypothetical protein